MQEENNCYDDLKIMTDNLIGVIDGDICTINQLNDLSYKGTQQTGRVYIVVSKYADDDEKKKFFNLCIELGIGIDIYPLCSKCGKTIYGVHTWGDDGAECFKCNKIIK